MTIRTFAFLMISLFISSNAFSQLSDSNNLAKSYYTLKVEGDDLDQDGDMDMVVVAQKLIVLKNTGSGNYEEITLDIVPANFYLIDLNNDNQKDILVEYLVYGGQFGFGVREGHYLNLGSMQFSELITNGILMDYQFSGMSVSTGLEPYIGHINNDEYLDRIIRSNTGEYEIGYLSGNANGFSENFTQLFNPESFLGLVDINEDGFLDHFYKEISFVGGPGSDMITEGHFTLNNGFGDFIESDPRTILLEVGNNMYPEFDYAKYEDFNSDGYKDIIMQSYLSYKFYAYSTLTNTFEFHHEINNGMYDILNPSAGLGSVYTDQSHLRSMISNCHLGSDLFDDGTYGHCTINLEPDPNTEIDEFYCYYKSTDTNVNPSDSVMIYKIPKYGKYYEKFDLPLNIFDVNGDGLQDILIGRNGLSVLYQQINQSFSEPIAIMPKLDYAHTGGSNPGFQTGDINGDGHLDIVAESRENILMAYVNQGNDTFLPGAIDLELSVIGIPFLPLNSWNYGYYRFILTDYDFDGFSDLILVWLDAGFTTWQLHLNEGNGQFNLVNTWQGPWLDEQFWPNNDNGRVKLVNLNNDAVPDFAFFADLDVDSFLDLGISDSDGEFQLISSDITDFSEGPFFPTDINSDGLTDVVVASFYEYIDQNNVTFNLSFRINNNGDFSQSTTTEIYYQYYGSIMSFEDVDGNGLMDIIFSHGTEPIIIYSQTSPLAFEVIEISIENPLQAILDVNQDQLPDFVFNDKVLISSNAGGFSEELETTYFSQFRSQNVAAETWAARISYYDTLLPLQYLQQINSVTAPYAKFIGREKETGWLALSTIDIESDNPTPLSTANVRVFMDTNENNLPDDGELILTNFPVTFDGEIIQYTSLTAGQTARLLTEGVHTISVSVDTELWTFAEAGNIEYIVDENTPTLQNVYFGIIPNGIIHRLEATVNVSPTICSTESAIEVQVINTGNQSSSGIIYTIIDPEMIITSIIPEPAYQIQDTIFWELTAMSPGSLTSFEIVAGNPNFESIGDTILSSVWASYLDDGNNILASDTSYSDQILLCAYDPNDITEHTGSGEEGIIDAGQQLDFTVRFQNTGNAPATNVRVEQTLSSLLEKGTLVPIAWSDPFTLNIDADGRAIFLFENIMLPDSTSDEPGSHGFIRYHIDALPDLSPGTVINSTAEIFFDFNPAVVTNTEVNTIFTPTIGIESLNIQHGIFVYPNPTNNFLKIMVPSNQIGNKLSFYNVMGQRVINDTLITSTQSTLDLSGLSKGVYLLSIGSERKTIVKE